MIFYLVYISSAKKLFNNEDLSDILVKSRSNNASAALTGLLLYHDGSILQILEGDKETVMNVYNKIEQDPRHHNIIKLVTGTSEKRNFPEWAMGFKTVNDSEWNDISGYLKLDASSILSHLTQENRKITTMINSYLSVNLPDQTKGPNSK